MKKPTNQTDLFKPVGRRGTLEPNLDPYQQQKSRSRANSAIALEKHTYSGNRQIQAEAVKNYLLLHPNSRIREIKNNLVYIDKHGFERMIEDVGTISARFDDLRKDGWDLLNNHGKWSVRKRENR